MTSFSEVINKYDVEYLSPACFDHELPSKMSGGLWLKRANDDTLVKGVTWNNLKTHNTTLRIKKNSKVYLSILLQPWSLIYSMLLILYL